MPSSGRDRASFDARYDTPLTNQNLIYGLPVKGNLGYDNAYIVAPDDIWRSVLYDRMNTTNTTIKMPTLARNLIDTNAVAVVAAWINSLPGTPTEPPPSITPAGGTYAGSVQVTVQPPDANAALYYTLDGSLPTTNSLHYSAPFILTNNATVSANAFESGLVNSVAVSSQFTILTNLVFGTPGPLSNGIFQVRFFFTPGNTYILQASTNLVDWSSISTNTPASSPFYWVDPGATNLPSRFYRAIQLP